ncbi:hypothetical protein [Xanthobacter tagetidis]|uniref:hypothetical protein n=1 Tax=Xanthobacter tagetidis TaxID=60216 RepID=UPI0011C447EE|nr:hypothetical protein [Xanthobacter tagetidis]MBB6309708.1 hypothetical protein [Xanthobacter tagetidis]
MPRVFLSGNGTADGTICVVPAPLMRAHCGSDVVAPHAKRWHIGCKLIELSGHHAFQSFLRGFGAPKCGLRGIPSWMSECGFNTFPGDDMVPPDPTSDDGSEAVYDGIYLQAEPENWQARFRRRTPILLAGEHQIVGTMIELGA